MRTGREHLERFDDLRASSMVQDDLRTSLVNSLVVAEPPRSAVRTLPSLSTLKTELLIALAK